MRAGGRGSPSACSSVDGWYLSGRRPPNPRCTRPARRVKLNDGAELPDRRGGKDLWFSALEWSAGVGYLIREVRCELV